MPDADVRLRRRDIVGGGPISGRFIEHHSG